MKGFSIDSGSVSSSTLTCTSTCENRQRKCQTVAESKRTFSGSEWTDAKSDKEVSESERPDAVEG